MKGKKNNLMNDKNLKKKIVVIGVVFFIISVGLNINIDYLFPPEKPKNKELDPPEKEPMVDPIQETVEEYVKQLEENDLSNFISEILDHGPHPTARISLKRLFDRGILRKKIDLPIEKVAEYIYSKLKSMGLIVNYQYWKQERSIRQLFYNFGSAKKINLRYILKNTFGFFTGKNIVATLPGTNNSNKKTYVLLAHYDTDFFSPGANDGTSGVAAVLAIAEIMSKYSFEHTVIFLFVDGQKQGCLGSEKYAKEAKEYNDNIEAVFCLDKIGYPSPDYTSDKIIFDVKETCWLSDHTRDVNKKYGNLFNLSIFMDDFGNNYGDHNSFLDEGYDAACISGSENENDRKRFRPSSDTYDKLDISYATKVSRLVLAAICELALVP